MTDLLDFNPEDIVETEVIEHDDPANDRSIARRMALQVLYEVDCAHHPVGSVIAARLEAEPISKKAARYLERLVLGVLEHRDRLDILIQQYATEWPLDQIAVVDRNILRLAIFEFAIETSAPVRVVIDEAVALARFFGGEGTIRFVNGVLGALSVNEAQVQQILGVGNGDNQAS